MAKTDAEKQKDYRDRKRNAQGPDKATRVTNSDDGNASSTDDVPATINNLIRDFGGPLCDCMHCKQNRQQGGRHTLNHGPYKASHELDEHELNRVSLPGDPDYTEEHRHEFK